MRTLPLIMRARVSLITQGSSCVGYLPSMTKYTTVSPNLQGLHATYDQFLEPLDTVLTNREGVTLQQLMELGNLLGNTKGRWIKREAGDHANSERDVGNMSGYIQQH